MLRERVLVLNQDYQAISVCTADRAFVLVFLNKAELIHACNDRYIRTVSRSFLFPSIIRLYRYVNVPFRRVALNRANLFRRDNYTCQYCGAKRDLTIDHVQPRSNGGRDSWDNLVTACQSCNTKKGNRTPEQADMPLKRKPYRPSFIMFLSDFSGQVEEQWRPYLMMN